MFLEDILHRFHRGTRGKRPAEAAMHSAVPPRSSCILKMSMLLFGPIHFFDRNTYIFYIYINIILYHYISIFSQTKGRKKSHPAAGGEALSPAGGLGVCVPEVSERRFHLRQVSVVRCGQELGRPAGGPDMSLCFPRWQRNVWKIASKYHRL